MKRSLTASIRANIKMEIKVNFHQALFLIAIVASALASALANAQDSRVHVTINGGPPAPTGEATPIISASSVRVTLIKTAEAPVPEAMLIAGGAWFTTVMLNHIAVLVEHPQHLTERLMFDAGLSASVESERQADLNWLYRQVPMLGYRNLRPARQQLPSELLPKMIALSHAHWDHASGLVDFPAAEVWAATAERQFAESSGPPAVFPSQVRGKTAQWKDIAFTPRTVCGFEQTHDVYGDGSVILVAMPGHTPGSVGMLVTTGSGRKLFFVGDTVWLKRAITDELPKPFISRSADNEPTQVRQQIARLAACVKSDSKIEIIPAHDSSVQDALGYYPRWVN